MLAITVVAVSQRIDPAPGRDEERDCLDQRLSTMLILAGATPVPVPNALGTDPARCRARVDNWLDRIGASAVVLSGGNDIGTRPARDAVERALLDHAFVHSMPTLGICRGMQMLGAWAGVDLVRVDGHVGTRHSVDGSRGEAIVNSYHAFALADCPDDFTSMATSPDGVLEAMRHDWLPWEGWMWHPEREPTPSHNDLVRIRALLCA